MVDRIRYAVFFMVLSVACAGYALTHEGLGRWFLLWSALSCVVLATAYARHRPDLVCGKQASGQVSALLVLINLPWLALTWLVWGLGAFFSREPAISAIPGTNLSIARYPLWGVDTRGFEHIVDLTAEFPCLDRSPARYQCLPNLDGVALHLDQPLFLIGADERVLVHCAQGHGRSATFAALLLARQAKFAIPEAAYLDVFAARPGARVSSSQRHQLQDSGTST